MLKSGVAEPKAVENQASSGVSNPVADIFGLSAMLRSLKSGCTAAGSSWTSLECSPV